MNVPQEVTIESGRNILNGVIHGKTIELERETGLPDGQKVSVALLPAPQITDALQRAFGAWRHDADELETFLNEVRQTRAGAGSG